ncbi:unnamed protein product [Nezara viridula]|uniref:VPS35 endosomal protein sorting factor-like n=1 Tax=Nezara viridula TaxID=85310 RepID=A0A9P0H9R8_NEZVI|nr:unnamed protein product [Nezara viridula]
MGTRNFEWNWKCKSTFEQPPIHVYKLEQTLSHPLKQINTTSKLETVSHNEKLSFIDPLSANFENADPLSLMAAQEDWDDLDLNVEPVKAPKRGLEMSDNPWIEQRTAILNKFTTTQKLSISLQQHQERGSSSRDIASNIGLKNKLEQLDDFEELTLRQLEQLSQAEYVETVNSFGKVLVTAWNHDFRVKALKVAIQCAKLLVDTSVVQFYPSKFVLITDVLDMFGNLVYERLLAKAEYYPSGSKIMSPLPENFTPDMVPESAKETCRNWFYKIASIRELIPRLYVEAAVLKSYTFLTNSELSDCVNRLTLMTRGIGDPLVAVYTRCYLCRIGQSVFKAGPELIRQNLKDFLLLYEQLFSPSVHHQLSTQKVDLASYLGTYVPALDWMFQGIANSDRHDFLDELFKLCMEKRNKGLLLNSILSTFKPEYIAQKAEVLVQQISSCFGESFPLYTLLKMMGERLRGHTTSNSNYIKREIWKLVSKLENEGDYLSCVQAWIPFIIAHSSTSELNIVLGDIIDRIGSSTKFSCAILQDIVITVASNFPDMDQLFTMDKFLPLLDVIRSESSRAMACQRILEIFCKSRTAESTADPVTTDALTFIAKVLHDSVNALSVDDEKRQYGQLISQLIMKIDFGDFEQQLRFYVEARATFMNLDAVIVTLVHCVNRIAVETGKKVKSHHTKRTAAFVHACAAFSYITIPSVTSEITRLRLYLVTAQIALFNQSLGQADACIASALAILPQLPLSVEIDGKMCQIQPYLSEFVKNLLSTLIIVPDCFEQGMLYLTRGLVNMLQQCVEITGIAAITRLYLDVIRMLSVAARPEYPYHVRKVDSNDILYGSDPKFLTEINSMSSILLEEILNNLQTLGEQKDLEEQAAISFELFQYVIEIVNLESEGMATLAYQLWLLSHKHKCLDKKMAMRLLDSLKLKLPMYPANSAFSLLVSKLKI